MAKTKLFLGIPSTGTRHELQNFVFRELQERYKDHIEFVWPKECVYRMFHDAARNGVVEEFLESGADILWFLDSDVVPPKHILDIVAVHGDKWEAAAAPYPLWMKPSNGSETCVLFTAYKGVVEDAVQKGFRMSEVPREGLDWVDAAATGCMFLKRSVFEKLQKPYFEFKYHPETRVMVEGEDLGFCLKLSKLGIKFFMDYSAVCKHYKQVCLLDVNNYATSWSNFKVLEYDREIRAKVQEATMAAYEAGYERGLKESPKTPRVSKTGLILPSNLST